MQYVGELISLGVALSWTVAALSCEVASRRRGVVVLNVWRMGLALLLSLGLMWWLLGAPYPVYASGATWAWLLASGVVGYFFGDWCLFNSYLTIGSRYGQLFMTLAPMFTALAAWVMIGQSLSASAMVAMAVTLLGIAISVLGRGEGKGLKVSLPTRGILYGIGAGLGQGIGLVLSKIGLDCYTADLPADAAASLADSLPFASNGIRCVAGLLCFTGWLLASGKLRSLAESAADTRFRRATWVAVLSGPVIGVGFSLMAVQYTAAGIASTLMATTPILILLPSRWLFGQPITWRGVGGAVISVVGVSLFFLL